ncbi:MAG: leucine-rich repeat domain-containing protein [Candidatus Poribacteria bacterium]|nr:leucine-rich repeat domain-containing protein [Candidatus Poribacteria bacterium]
MNQSKYFYRIFLTIIALGFIHTASAQQELAQQAYLILQTKCLDCHGPHGTFTENLVIDSASGLVDTGTVVPGQPLNSNLYARLITTDNTKRMPLRQAPLDDASLQVISDWIAAGAPSWETQHDVTFIPTDAMLTTMQQHLQTLNPFDQPFARYFTMTHLYNAGKSLEARNAYKIALAKLVNSLSWGFDIHNPHPIDDAETIFYIDLRNYDWDLRDAWTQIENVYPYAIAFDEETQAGPRAKLANLQQTMDCEVPFVHVDWFLATASLPPLYHNILRLPETERELERELGVDADRNLQRDPGRRVWRAGTNDSGVSNHNRVVERHTARYGAYWKSHDFAGSTDAQNIFTHPLSFARDGGEAIFNLPNGLQAYYIADKSGTRIDVAPTDIVSDPAAKDPAVRNGLSCIGCHTEGMKTITDQVRSVIEQTANPRYDKGYALLLYVTQDKIDALLAEDTARYKTALEKTGGVFGGIEPVHRFHEAFQDALEAPDAAAAVGLQTEDLLSQIRVKSSLQNLGLTGLTSGGNVKRDAWTQQFSEIITALNSPDTPVTTTPSIVRPIQPTPSGTVHIPDPILRSMIEQMLEKENGAAITPEDMERLNEIEPKHEKGIRDLTGLEYATNLERIRFEDNTISDLTPLTNLIRLNSIKLRGNQITDVAPLAKLFNVEWMGLEANQITDLSPLQNLKKLNGIGISGNPVTDVSPLARMISLEGIAALNTRITDFSPLANLPRLQWIEFGNATISILPSLTGIKTLTRLKITGTKISDISRLAALTQLTQLDLERNLISDISSLSNLKKLIELRLDNNLITDISPLSRLTNLQKLSLTNNAILDFSPLEGLPEIITLNAQGNPGDFTDISAPKITKSWLWMIVPTGNIGGARAARSGVDFLARASDGEVTELKVATEGTTEGNPVGSKVWTIGEISPTYHSNLEIMGHQTNLLLVDHANHVAYGFLTLESPREQQTKMLIGSSDAVKVWLNGELVHYNFVNRYSNDYQDQAPVTLKTGENILLVAVYNSAGRWSGFFGFTSRAEYTVLPPGPRFSLTADTTEFQTDTQFVIHLKAANMEDLAGWQTDILFDPAILKANSITEGNFLKHGNVQTYFRSGTIDNTTGRITGISATRFTSGVEGSGTLLAINFTLKNARDTRIQLRNLKAGDSNGQPIHTTSPIFRIRLKTETPTTIPAWDVNEDGKVDITDLVSVAAALGSNSPENPRLDVNADGTVNIQDLILVATHLGETTGAAAPTFVALPERLTPETLQQVLDLLGTQNDGSLAFQRAIANLEQLLAALVPKETALLANYPNPFNPETWIPYQLAESAEVTLHIYAINGKLVRTLALGHQRAGIYQTRTRAAYWDGKNALGEPVASGIYFYTLSTESTRDSVTASEFTSTRKMLIRK